MPDLFSPAGIEAWRARLADSATFHDAARGWSGTVLLVARDATGPDRRTYLALDDGQLHAARPANGDDEAAAEFVLVASGSTWDALSAGESELIAVAMRGELKLERGNLLRLIPHARAAAAMLRG